MFVEGGGVAASATITPDNKHLYVSSNIGRDKTAIVKYDVENKKRSKRSTSIRKST